MVSNDLFSLLHHLGATSSRAMDLVAATCGSHLANVTFSNQIMVGASAGSHCTLRFEPIPTYHSAPQPRLLSLKMQAADCFFFGFTVSSFFSADLIVELAPHPMQVSRRLFSGILES